MRRARAYVDAMGPAISKQGGHPHTFSVACRIVDADHLPAVVGRMFAPDMFSGWGVRTLSSNHAYYNPVSYHRGTVWAVEKATILFGLRREVLEGGAVEPDEVLDAIDAVTAEDVQRVAQEVLGSNALRLAVIGPFDDAERFEKLLAV